MNNVKHTISYSYYSTISVSWKIKTKRKTKKRKKMIIIFITFRKFAIKISSSKQQTDIKTALQFLYHCTDFSNNLLCRQILLCVNHLF
jgi:hypothetical protein